MPKKDELAFWNHIAPNYDEAILHTPPPIMREYESWEDQQLDSILSCALEKPTVFLELGCGTGRYLMRYGKLVDEDPCFNDKLLAIVGLDFSEQMIRTSIRNLKLAHLEKLIGKRIFLVRADATKPPINMKKASFNNLQKVVTIMFGTIGNIKRGRKRLLRYLSSNLLNINGIGVISFFNRDALTAKGGGLDEYSLIPEIVGNRLEWNPDSGVVKSERKFFTEWFRYDDFARMIEASNLEIIQKLEGPGPKIPKTSRVPLWIKVPRGYMVLAASKHFYSGQEVKKTSEIGKTPPGSQSRVFHEMLRCPECRTDDIDIRSSEILCQKCGARFPIRNIEGVRVPDFLNRKS